MVQDRIEINLCIVRFIIFEVNIVEQKQA